MRLIFLVSIVFAFSAPVTVSSVSKDVSGLSVYLKTFADQLMTNQSIEVTYYLKGQSNESNVVFEFMSSHKEILAPIHNVILNDFNASTTRNFTIKLHAKERGKTVVTVKASSSEISTSKAILNISVFSSDVLQVVSEVIGWIYFVAWSISFYPQIWENWKRKCVIGLNFDFLTLNIIGFTMYSLYNVGLFWITGIQDEYKDVNKTEVIPVKLNDVFFGLHAIFACAVTIVQCLIYERGVQAVSRTCMVICALMGLFFLAVLISTLAQALTWLTFLTYASYIKLFITLIKYVPQAYMNFVRKSTVGWSIGNVLLDFTGGSFSMLQMILDSYNYNDWTSFVGDPTKLGLGLFSVAFDMLFMLQHYVCFRNRQPLEDTRILVGDDNAAATAGGGHGAANRGLDLEGDNDPRLRQSS